MQKKRNKRRVKRSIDRNEVYRIILDNWPIHVTEAAEKMNMLSNVDEDERKLVITHLKYHFDQLARHEKIKVKKIGKAVVAWPIEIEKLRMVHEMMKGI